MERVSVCELGPESVCEMEPQKGLEMAFETEER